VVALVACVLGSVFGFSSESRTVEDGVVTSCTYLDWFAIVAGGVAIFASSVATVDMVKRPASPFRVLGLGLAAVTTVVGMVHIARGLGIVGSSC
jgi:hypothetical protein